MNARMRAGNALWVIPLIVVTLVMAAGTALTDGEHIGTLMLVCLPVMVALIAVPIVRGVRMLQGKVSARFADAPLGMATIQSVSPTGTTISDNPLMAFDVTVDAPDGQSFPSRLEQLVPLHLMHMYRPGVVVPVHFLSDDHSLVVLADPSSPDAQRAFETSMLRKGLTTEAALDVARRGEHGSAVVLSIAPTGVSRDGNPEITFRLAVTPASGPIYDTEVTKVVPASMLPALQPGCVVDVRYLPEQPGEVTFALRMA